MEYFHCLSLSRSLLPSRFHIFRYFHVEITSFNFLRQWIWSMRRMKWHSVRYLRRNNSLIFFIFFPFFSNEKKTEIKAICSRRRREQEKVSRHLSPFNKILWIVESISIACIDLPNKMAKKATGKRKKMKLNWKERSENKKFENSSKRISRRIFAMAQWRAYSECNLISCVYKLLTILFIHCIHFRHFCVRVSFSSARCTLSAIVGSSCN